VALPLFNSSTFDKLGFFCGLILAVSILNCALARANMTGLALVTASKSDLPHTNISTQLAVHFRPGGEELDRRKSDPIFMARIKSLEATGGCRGCDLRGADFDDANLNGADLVRVDFTAVKLKGATLVKADLTRAILFGAILVNADLRDARLVQVDLRKANLQNADLSGANLGFSNLRKIDLRNANLKHSVLRGADLSGARMKGANLSDADLREALVEKSSMTKAILCRTTLPWGLNNRDCAEN
tara:strand:+ start:44415 stop:45146 length:732 start_codon:yes stop_codon:yes gene_type:complete